MNFKFNRKPLKENTEDTNIIKVLPTREYKQKLLGELEKRLGYAPNDSVFSTIREWDKYHKEYGWTPRQYAEWAEPEEELRGYVRELIYAYEDILEHWNNIMGESLKEDISDYEIDKVYKKLSKLNKVDFGALEDEYLETKPSVKDAVYKFYGTILNTKKYCKDFVQWAKEEKGIDLKGLPCKESYLREDNYKRFKRKEFNIIGYLKDLLSIGQYGRMYNTSLTQDDDTHFSIVIRYPNSGEVAKKYEAVAPKLKSIGAKNLSKEGSKYTSNGYIKFVLPLAVQENIIAELNDAENKREMDYASSINGVDLSTYEPSDKVLGKLREYRDRGSKINVNAIKDLSKVLTYLYGSIMLDMPTNDLEYRAMDLGASKNIINAIFEKADKQEVDARSSIEQEKNLPASNLFTFEDKHCWLPKKIFQYFIDNNIPVHFGKRTSGDHYDHNGAQWTEIEHLTLFPGTGKEINYDIAVHTSEGGGNNRYTGNNTATRTSINDVIADIEDMVDRRR